MEILTFKMRLLNIDRLKKRKRSLASLYLKQNKMPSEAYFFFVIIAKCWLTHVRRWGAPVVLFSRSQAREYFIFYYAVSIFTIVDNHMPNFPVAAFWSHTY